MEVLLTKEYITGLIEKKGMSKAEFAKQMGYQRQNLDAMLESKKKDINTVIKMAEVLKMPLEEFLYGKKEDAGVRVNGFLKVNGSIVEVSSKADLERIMAEIEKLEKSDISPSSTSIWSALMQDAEKQPEKNTEKTLI